MLRATRRVLKRGGRTAFLTIHEPPGLSPRQRRRARSAGPRGLATRSDYPSLLSSAGFADVEAIDVTEAFRTTLHAWLRESDRHAVELASVQGPGVFEERQEAGRGMLAAVDEGLLRRSLFVASRS